MTFESQNYDAPNVERSYAADSNPASKSDVLQLLVTAVNDILRQHLQAIAKLCDRYEVQLLELFGSAARGDFDPLASDFDFLVAFLPHGKLKADDRFLGLLVDLEDLLGRKIDLVDVCSHSNPFFMAEALKHRVRLYAA